MARLVSLLLFVFIFGNGSDALAQTDSLTRRDSLIIKSRDAMARYFELRARSREIMDSIEASHSRIKASKKKGTKPKTKAVPKDQPFRANDSQLNPSMGIDSFLGAFYKLYNSKEKTTTLEYILKELRVYWSTGLLIDV